MQRPRGIHFTKARMMTIKHLIAGAVVTVAVTSALVLGSAVTAQASIFPPPTPVGPGKIDLPIYTQPSLPGFHLPKELWTKYGPQVQPKRPHPYTHALGCPDVFTPYATAALAREGYVLTSDSAIHVTTDPLIGGPDSDSWWDVPVSEVSELQSTQAASAAYEESKKTQRPYLTPAEGNS